MEAGWRMEDGGGWWWVVRIDLRLAKERKTPTPTVDSERENKALAIFLEKVNGSATSHHIVLHIVCKYTFSETGMQFYFHHCLKLERKRKYHKSS